MTAIRSHILVLAMLFLSAPSVVRGSGEPFAPNCDASPVAVPGEAIAPGWNRVYRAGCADPSGKLAGGSEILHLVPHRGRLYAAAGYWMDKRNVWYGGKDPLSGWGQILRMDGPGGRWHVDLNMPMHLRPEILKSVRLSTDGTGRALSEPIDLLLAATYARNGSHGITLFTRDDTTGRWEVSKIIAGDTGQRHVANSVRAIQVHRDSVTGVDRVFVSIGVLGVFSGVYDASLPGRIRWDQASETGPVSTRPLAITEADGALVFSADKRIYRRNDGPRPTWTVSHDLSDLHAGSTSAPVGGIRGLTAIDNPRGPGHSLLFVWAPDNHSRGCVMRLDPDGHGAYTRTEETCLDKVIGTYLGGSQVSFVIAGYNRALAVLDPVTGRTVHLIGIEAWIDGTRAPTAQSRDGVRGFYSGALYAIREGEGRYRIAEVNGSISARSPPLVAVRDYTPSPFPADHGEVLYFGGYDCNSAPSSDTAWIFRTTTLQALHGRSTP